MKFFDSQSPVGAENVTTDLEKPQKSDWRTPVRVLLLLILTLIVITLLEMAGKAQALAY